MYSEILSRRRTPEQTYIDRRRELMNEWAAFVTGASVSTTGHH